MKEGIIERTDEYKYLGWWFSEANNIRRQLHDGRIQKMLYEKVVLPTITFNMESMTYKEIEDMEMIQNVEENIQSISINLILGITD